MNKVTVVVGGQYGSEGKGKVVADIAARSKAASLFVVRCGGPNSGHSIVVDGKVVVLKALPSGAGKVGVSKGGKQMTYLVIPAAAVVDIDQLKLEVDMLKIDPSFVLVDSRAVVVTEEDRVQERIGIKGSIGSTASGNGEALIRRMRRRGDTLLMGGMFGIGINQVCTVCDVAELINVRLKTWSDVEVVIEGNQGFGLSLLYGDYPFVTSRDTTASAFCSEVGISPRAVTDIVMVIRTFPIRVGGNSGPMFEEKTWEEVAKIGGWPFATQDTGNGTCDVFVPDPREWTSVTKKLRRVGMMDWAQLLRASQFNQPTAIAVMGLDRLDWSCRDLTSHYQLKGPALDFAAKVEVTSGVQVRWIGTGPTNLLYVK